MNSSLRDSRSQRRRIDAALLLPALIGVGVAAPVLGITMALDAVPFLDPVLVEGAADDWLGIAAEASVGLGEIQAGAAADLITQARVFALALGFAALASLVLAVLVRAASLRTETALRAALGASARHITAERLRRAAPVAMGAAAGGLFLAAAISIAAGAAWHPAASPAAPQIVLAASAIGALLLGSGLGLWLSSGRVDRSGRIAGHLAAGTGPSAAEGVVRTTAGVLQMAAASVVLLAAAALASPLVLDPPERALSGLDPADTVVAQVRWTPERAAQASVLPFWESGGREGAALTASTPGALAGLGRTETARVYCAGCATAGLAMPVVQGPTRVHAVSANYFEVHGVEIVRGRAFGAGEAGAVVVSETFAHRLVPGSDPIGIPLHLREAVPRSMADEERRLTIVGVVRDVRAQAPGNGQQPVPAIYHVLEDHPPSVLTIAARSPEGTARAGAALEGVLSASTAGVLIAPRDLTAHLAGLAGPIRWLGRVVILLAGATLLVSVYAVFALMRDAVARRTPEIGVRRALGARARDIFVLVFGWAGAVVAGGAALGSLASVPLVRWLQLEVMGVDALSADVTLSIAGMLLVVTVIAAVAPARRAVAIPPDRAIRWDE